MNLSGGPLDFLWAFFGGVLVSFTPCVYPLLPIIIAYTGITGVSSRARGFTLSLLYVGGISLTYVILGLAAVLTGSIFGRFSNLPSIRIVAGLIIALFGFSLWTGRGFKLPALKFPALKKSGTYFSCFVLGLTSGLVVTPCVAPVLGSILTIVVLKKNFVYGSFLLFSFAYGMGSLLILAGTFSSILAALPKSGYWMEIMKKICAVILIVAGIYFVFSGAADLVPLGLSSNLPVRGLGLMGLAYAQDAGFGNREINFSLYDLKGNMITLSKFRDKHPAILFFWTIWCPFCIQELRNLNKIYPSLASDNITVLAINIQESELKVSKFLKRNPLLFKVLLDSDASVAYSYGLIGVPTYVFIDKKGEIVFQDNYFPQRDYKDYLIGNETRFEK